MIYAELHHVKFNGDKNKMSYEYYKGCKKIIYNSNTQYHTNSKIYLDIRPVVGKNEETVANLMRKQIIEAFYKLDFKPIPKDFKFGFFSSKIKKGIIPEVSWKMGDYYQLEEKKNKVSRADLMDLEKG